MDDFRKSADEISAEKSSELKHLQVSDLILKYFTQNYEREL